MAKFLADEIDPADLRRIQDEKFREIGGSRPSEPGISNHELIHIHISAKNLTSSGIPTPNWPTTYPFGAIETENELHKLAKNGPEIIWQASRKFSYNRTPDQLKITGITGIRSVSGKPYFWYERIASSGAKYQESLSDRNIPLNGYNDWFLFSNYYDAMAYLNRP